MQRRPKAAPSELTPEQAERAEEQEQRAARLNALSKSLVDAMLRGYEADQERRAARGEIPVRLREPLAE